MSQPLIFRYAVITVTTTGLVLAQTAPAPSNGGWRRATDPAPSTVAAGQDPEPVDRSDAYGQPSANGSMQPAPNNPAVPNEAPPNSSQPQNPQNSRPYGVPPQLTMKSGAYITVRLNEGLSSDRNQQGDPFSATLEQPLIVDGIVVAERGQTVYGRVAGVQKQKADQPSKIALQLTSVTLADGTQTPITSQLVGRTGGRTPAGIQAGTVVGTTAVGAGIGAIAGWGTGAAIGAGAGAAAGLIGVLLTRNHPTVVYPETALTFQITSPVNISTVNAPQAFRYVSAGDYNYPAQVQRRAAVQPCYGCGPRPAPYPAWYGPAPYPYAYAYPYPYWGPGFSVWVGPGFGFRGYRRWR